MSVIAIPLNIKGKLTIINGIETLEHFWNIIVLTAHSLYENNGFDEDCEQNIEYRKNHILSTLQGSIDINLLDPSIIPDPMIVTLFQYHELETIGMLIKHGENSEWDF
ncbi:hypothetical protein [Moritella sp. F3]|uniref:hypothetical protein n=1 Tax=Moritella sp. F3 TaxID=2718882 RepID=UPI0018E1A7EC|nr:hypothetical protein [Moritella sp. F3]GIC77725.1 hypothetical protein FMO001_24520 [Moritella sp. F1]GIC82138.1 hypothetical protein FMO003_24190 [Moritella sp. F3]